jgi:hypothetical protein
MAAMLAAPVLALSPTNAAVLFSCTTIGAGSYANIAPGLSHDQTAQTADGQVNVSGCSNGQTGTVNIGSPFGHDPFVSFPSRPLGCPVPIGGAGPDYADQTPILVSSGGFGFLIDWSLGADSHGIAKAKSSGPTNPTKVRVVFVINSGQYLATSPAKTKVKGVVTFDPTADPDGFVCADNSNPIEKVSLSLGAGDTLIVQQK